MKKLFFFAFTVLSIVFAAVVTSCDNEKVGDQAVTMADTIRIVKGYEYEPSLAHKWDSVMKTTVKDYMDSKLEIWSTRDGQRQLPSVYNNTVHPEVIIGSLLAKQDYAIQENQVDIKPSSSTIIRDRKVEENGTTTELDTVRYWFPDNQIWSIPVKVTNDQVTVGGSVFDFPSVTLIGHEFQYLKNTKRANTRAAAQYKSAEYSTEYKSVLSFKETNIESPKTMKAPIYAFTGRYVMSDDELDKVVLADSSRVWVNDSTDKCSVTLDSYYKSGIKITDKYEFLAKHKFNGHDPYEKTVSNFEHKWRSSNPIVWEGEKSRASGDELWTVLGKKGTSYENIENGTTADKLSAGYDYYIESPTFKKSFKDTTVVVNFGYPAVKLDHMQTSITSVKSDKQGMKKAEVKDVLGTTYLGGAQTLSDLIYIYTASKDTKDVEIINPVIEVIKDSVIADLDFVKKLEDGTEIKEHAHWSAPRTLECTTNWESIQEILSQTTDDEAAVSLSGSATKEKGYWHWTNETRTITTHCHLYNGEDKLNSWTSVVPNKVSYTREGKTHTFDVIVYKIDEKGAALNLRTEEDKFSIYDYTDVIEENYGGYAQSSTAPGVVKIAKDNVVGHEFRNKTLVITNTDVTASMTYVTKYSDGREDTQDLSKTFPRTLSPYTNWSVNETNISVLTSAANVKVTGSEDKTDGNWSYTQESRNITTTAQLQNSNQTNGLNTVDPNNIKYTVNGETCDFGTISFSATEKGQEVKINNETSTLSTYDYTDKVEVTFGDNTQSVTLPGTINVAKEKTIVGYEITNQNMTVDQYGVTTSLTFITKWSDGTQDEDFMSKTFARNFNVVTNWSSNESNANQTTGSASVNLTGSENNTDGDWSYVRETRSITTTATLNGSSQTNGWESSDPNRIVFSKNGKTYDFGTISFSATETGASVNKQSETADETVYSYTDNISVAYGTNSFNSSAPGQIKVATPWDPDFDYGKFTGCVITTARNEARDTWVYVVSVHFETGTLPVIIRRDANAPEVNKSYFENNTDSRLNSGTWIPSWGKWINTIATDTPDLMQWDTTDGANADNMAYPTATAWGWDYGYTVGSHPSVTTDKFSASISSDGYVLTIYKGSNVFATYKAAKH